MPFTPKWYAINKADLSVCMKAVGKGHRGEPVLYYFHLMDHSVDLLTQEMRQGREGLNVSTTDDAGAIVNNFRLMILFSFGKINYNQVIKHPNY